MKIRYENGIDYHFDFEIDKALHQFECGVPIIDFLKYEAENFKYGKDAYFNVLNKEIEDYESRDWDYLIKANQLHPYEVSDIIEGVDTIKNAIADIQNATPPELKSTNTPHPKLIKTLSTIQQKNLFDMLIDNELLSSETDFDSFCFVFGSYLMPNDFKPLKWLTNRQLLRELITELKHPDVIIRTTKYILPTYFIDKNDKPITELPTNTPKDLKIEHYLNNLAKI